ncbi:MAG: hypothetical protein HUU35_08690, partial [Armatimonadetes bacterium]|nr:hypothetical protein [Armatimonadota bacterium]
MGGQGDPPQPDGDPAGRGVNQHEAGGNNLQPPPVFPEPIRQADFEVDALLAEQGNTLWARHCVLCHGAGVVSGGYAPDLRASTIP